ncbi:hypothetical protein SAMN05216559_1644 [Halomicrobium zhouii]|uniref:Uncharacterized protein n=1 Tax=Halomicrobium zhouii TaxID=767519 RepID=A0A1I6KZD5_9EURY|nr:hypothetical protein [Halomicrobium zhouii]SFR96564.1 hypothetical protein SAMN05216559_1644 [Halomicrobium zhouii]
MTGSKPGRETSRRASTTLVALGLVVTVLVIGGMLALGQGPLGGAGDAQTTPAQTTEHGEAAASDDDSSGGGERPFTIDVQKIENCGKTCRDVTVSLTNNGGNPRENISVTTTVYAGQDSVWQGEAAIGTLASDESTRRTEQIDVGYVGGAKIERNGGTVTIETVVHWDGGEATYREQKQVS